MVPQIVMDSTFAWALGAFVPCILYFGLLDHVIHQVAPHPRCQFFLDERLFGVDDVQEYLICLGEPGRQLYLLFYRVDFVLFPITYGLILHHLLRFAWRNACISCCSYCQCANKWMVALPASAVVFDVTENSLIVFLLNQFPVQFPMLEQLVGKFTQLKFGMCGVCLVAVMVGMVLSMRKRSNHSKSA